MKSYLDITQVKKDKRIRVGTNAHNECFVCGDMFLGKRTFIKHLEKEYKWYNALTEELKKEINSSK